MDFDEMGMVARRCAAAARQYDEALDCGLDVLAGLVSITGR